MRIFRMCIIGIGINDEFVRQVLATLTHHSEVTCLRLEIATPMAAKSLQGGRVTDDPRGYVLLIKMICGGAATLYVSRTSSD